MKSQELRLLHHCVYSLQYHLVLVTKYRRRCITKPMLARLQEIFQELCLKWDCKLVEFNGEADHVHLLISLNPKVNPSTFINNLKTVSSRYIRKEFLTQIEKFYQKPVFWSRTYCLLTCGGAPLSIIKKYIEQQCSIE